MKKLLLFILALCAGFSAYAQMATTTENGHLISNDERKIHFRTRAKKLYAELDPNKHNKGTNPNTDPDDPVQINWINNGWGQDVKTDNLLGYTDDQGNYHAPNYSYSFSDGVGHFHYENVSSGTCRVNLFDRVSGGLLRNYESFVIRTSSISTPRKDQRVTYNFGGNNNQSNPQSVRYLVQFCNVNEQVIHSMCIYSDDVKVVHLSEFFTPEQIDQIHAVWLQAGGHWDFLDGDINVAECYFISAYNMDDEEYFKDMDGNYIGNAYIHPSYFICSNNVTLDEETGVLSVDEGGQKYESETLAKSRFNNEENCEYSLNESVNCVYGNSTVLTEEYADLSDFDRISIRVNDGMPRLFFNTTGHDDEVNHIHIDKSSVIVTDGSSFFSHPDPTWNPDLYQIDLAAIKREYGAVKLNAIKASAWDTYVTVSSILIEKLNHLQGPAHIQLSVPFDGFDMRDITVVTFDNEEDGDVIWRNIYGHHRYKNVNKTFGSEIDLSGDNSEHPDCRTLYTSRYNADFLSGVSNPEYLDEINNIYWETNYRGTDNPTGTMTVNDICFTKNHVVARNGGNHTLLGANDGLFKKYEDGECSANGSGFSSNIGKEGSDKFVYGNSSVVWNCYADLGGYYKMQIKGNSNDQLRIIINRPEVGVNGGDQNGGGLSSDNQVFVRLDENGLANVDIADIVNKRGSFHLNSIKGANDSPVHVDYIKLYGTEDGVVEFNQDMYHTWNRAENGTVTRKKAFGSAYENKIGKDQNGNPQPVSTSQNQDVIFGHNFTFVKEDYAELTGYKAIKVTGTPGMVIRVIYNCTKNRINQGQGDDNCIIKEKNLTIGADGVGTLDIRDYVYFHLHGMKVGSGSGTIDKVELISDERVDYVLEGNGTLSMNPADVLAYGAGGKNANIGTCAIDAINDVGARVIDARPRVSISRVALAYPANPNCLILMRENLSRKQFQRNQFDTPSKEGVNANMIKIGGLPSNPDNMTDRDAGVTYEISSFSADNVNLFDGYSFSAPRKVTVNGTSTLTRQTTANKINTLILPFASDDVKGTAYETFKSKYAEFDVEKQGILNDVDIKAGDHVLLFDVKGKSVDAYTPYLYVADNTSDATVIVGSGDIEQTPEVGTDEAPGEYMTNNRPADEEDRHYLRGFMESTHVEDIYGYKADGTLVRAKNATMTPFRVIIQAPIDIDQDHLSNVQPTGNVKIILSSDFDDDTPTEIKAVDAINMESIVDVYSANGALIRRNVKAADALRNLPKGVYVVGGKKVVK